MCICFFGLLWFRFWTNTPHPQCTPDASPSVGSNGSDCCSTNGIDANGNCQPRGPMGVPRYGIPGAASPPVP
jgi:hypothetical protein